MGAEPNSAAVPQPVMGLFDRAFWESIQSRQMALQRCEACGAFWYPPGPLCPNCLSERYAWTPLSGAGAIVSWAVFHRQYLPAYPPPHNCIAVRLDEGPIMISNLEGKAPEGSWIGRRVQVTYVETANSLVLPRFLLD